MKDLRARVKPVVCIPCEALDADTTPVAVDLVDFNSACVEFVVGVGGITFTTTNKIEFVLTHSDDNSTYANVELADVDLAESNVDVCTDGIVYSLIAAHTAGTTLNVGYRGGKRYLKVLADFSGTHGVATPLAVNVLKGKPLSVPTA